MVEACDENFLDDPKSLGNPEVRRAVARRFVRLQLLSLINFLLAGGGGSDSGLIYLGALSTFILYAQNARPQICSHGHFLPSSEGPALGSGFWDTRGL